MRRSSCRHRHHCRHRSKQQHVPPLLLLLLLLCALLSTCCIPTVHGFSFGKFMANIALPTLTTTTGSSSSSTTNMTPTPPSNVKLLILPGFGNESADYFLQATPVGSLVTSLQKRGWKADQIHVLPCQRTDWLQVFARGIWDIDFWRAQAPPTRPFFAWYLERIATSIQEMIVDNDNTNNDDDNNDDDDTKIVLVGHSAGGWLARAALGFLAQNCQDDTINNSNKCIPLDRILGIVTLGAPHQSPPPEIMDVTRGALRITNEQFPGAFYHDNNLFYITAIGNAIGGVKQEKRESIFAPRCPADFAYSSYEQVCGNGNTDGDGVVPISAAHLDNAIQLNLQGIFHSINKPEQWYGSDAVLDLWHDDMIREIHARTASSSTANNVFANSKKNPLLESIFW